MSTLSARAAYPLWASRYEAETAVSVLDEALALRLAPPRAGVRLLDAGCGTGRRLPARDACGVDLSPEMLAAGARRGVVAAADLRALPFADRSFGQVWCRLVIGHLPDAAPALAELARVCRPGGSVLLTDFHPAAAAAGHRRTFRDADGVVREIEHHPRSADALGAAGACAGLRVDACEEGVVGPAVEALYAAHGRLEAYREQLGLPLVLALRFIRP